jgi:hypothetical protein
MAITQTFDLRPFRPRTSFTRSLAFRTMLLLGLGFTGLGIAIGFGLVVTEFAGLPATDRLTGFIVCAAGFGGSGFAPLLLAVLGGRPWRYLTTLRIGPGGFSLEDSTGKSVSFSWDDPNLTITVRESHVVGGTARSLAAEEVIIMPSFVVGRIGREAATALLEAARRHDLVLGEDSFASTTWDRGWRPTTVVDRSAVAPSFASQFTESERELALPAGDHEIPLPRTFDLSSVTPPIYGSGPAARSNGLREVTVTPNGLDLVDERGKKHHHGWTDEGLRIDMIRRLPSPLDQLRRPNCTWSLQVEPPKVSGFVSGACYGSIVTAARVAGLVEVTHRTLGLSRPPGFWVGETKLRPPRK